MMGYYYLATPYSKYPRGVEAAFRLACGQAGLLVRAGVPVFCPIAHTHPIAVQCGLNQLDLEFWLNVDMPLMDAAQGLIFLKAASWELSVGMAREREIFVAAGKPVVDMVTGTVPPELLPTPAGGSPGPSFGHIRRHWRDTEAAMAQAEGAAPGGTQ